MVEELLRERNGYDMSWPRSRLQPEFIQVVVYSNVMSECIMTIKCIRDEQENANVFMKASFLLSSKSLKGIECCPELFHLLFPTSVPSPI